jgi:hypothetical protein
MSDIDYSDEIEVGLDQEVGAALDRFRQQPEAPYEEPMDQQEVAERITRIANEIQQVIPLLLPKRNIAAPEGEPAELPQDKGLAQAAKNLLIAQITKLQQLVQGLE